MKRIAVVLASLVLAGLVLAPSASGSEPTQSMTKFIPVSQLSVVLPQLAAGAWRCDVDVNLATGLPATHYAYGQRGYYYVCTR